MRLELIVDGHYLGLLSPWGELEWGLCWPGYSDELTFDVAHHSSILRIDAPVALVRSGEVLFSGTLDEPVRGQRLRAAGLFRKGEQFSGLDGVGNLSLVPDVAVSEAIERGLPWTKYDLAFGTPPLESNVPLPVSSLIAAQVAMMPGYGWGVSPTGEVLRQAHTAPRLHVRPGGDGLGIAWDNYASTLIASYLDSSDSTYKTLIRSDAAAVKRWGYREFTIPEPLNKGASMSTAQATAIVDGILAAGRSRPGWTTPIEVEFGAVLNNRQMPVDLSTIRPYEKIRVHGLSDDVVDLAGMSYVDVPLARITHRGPRTVLTPVGLVSPMQEALVGQKAA